MDLIRLLGSGWNYLTSLNRDGYISRQTKLYSPTHADVCVARALLKTLGLPTEIVLEILDYAQYDPILRFASTHATTAPPIRRHFVSPSAELCLQADILTQHTLRQLHPGKAKVKVKEIEFLITSQDQGWTSENTRGTFETSSWLEVSILRDIGAPHPFEAQSFHNLKSPKDLQSSLQNQGKTLVTRPPHAERGPQAGEGDFAWYLQGNRVASNLSFKYRVVWGLSHTEGNEGAGKGEGFLEELKPEDRILIWARAKYPLWMCHVDNIKVNVRYNFLES